jgi:AcrR family transcriptional regulator
MTVASRRPGPRADLDVRATLIQVAEAMFGESSVDAVSLRAVARRAGVAPAAVSYHFPAKASLTAAVIQRRGRDLGREIRGRLQALVDAADGPTVRDVVDALLEPMVAMINADPVGGLAWMKTFTRLGLTDDAIFYDEVAVQDDMNVLFVQAASRALPNLSDPAVAWRRVGIAIFSMLTALSGADLQGYGKPLGPDGLEPVFVEQLARFTSAGMLDA